MDEKLPAPIDNPKYDIAEMRQLSVMQQRFVVAVAEGIHESAAACLKVAGHKGSPGVLKQQAYRWMHNPAVQAAIRALIPAKWHELGPKAIDRIFQIAMDPSHRDSFKACMAIKEYIAPLAQEHKIVHELGERAAATAGAIQSMARELNLDNATLAKLAEVVRKKAPPTIEQEAVDLSDLEDVL